MALTEGRAAARALIEPLAGADYFRIEGDRLAAGSRMVSADDSRTLRGMMDHILVMRPIWDAWETEKAGAGAPPRRKKRTEDFCMEVSGFGPC